MRPITFLAPARCLIWLAIAFAVATFASAQDAGPRHVTIQPSGEFVIDRANLIDGDTREALTSLLRELEEKTSAQVKLLTVPTLGDEDDFTFAQRHAELWKLGDKAKDNGALIVLALQEHKTRIQTGRGLEGALPDSWCGTAERQVRAFFKEGRFAQGLTILTTNVANKVAQEYGVTLTGQPKLPRAVGGGGGGGGQLFLMILIALIIFSFLGRGRRRGGWGNDMGTGFLLGNILGSGGGFSSGGWSGGAGGSAGWSGSFGGGGDFGGGGASDSW